MTDAPHLETARLLLRPIVADDFALFYARLVCDPVVMAFYHAYARPMADIERRARAQRDFFDHFADGAARFGYICWAITDKRATDATDGAPGAAAEAGEFLGWAGVLTPALEDAALGPELAYMIASPFHGQGLTTEAADVVIADAFPRYGLAALHAVVDAPNVASRRVAEKLGFTYEGPVRVYGSEDMVLYTLDKQEASRLKRE
ncbi:MAG: GNAT family N-acetyltransferase [Gemmatimonadaceae bacterium]